MTASAPKTPEPLDTAAADVVDAPNAALPTSAPARKPRRRRVLLWLAGPLVVGGAFAWGFIANADAVSTDNAYVKADRVMIAPQVAGRVTEVLVAQNQPVQAGDVLFRLDTDPLRIALDQARAHLAQVADGSGANRAALRQAQAAVDKARLTLGGRSGDAIEQLPDYRAAQAAVEKAELDLAHAEVRAPVAGIVGSHDLQPGEYLNVGQAAFPLVAGAPVWIEANFKETDLARMRVGQPADIRVDSYPGRHWQARIASISPASGAEFSVLPPQNASGNWVKIVQRIPVRLELEAVPADSPPLRAGMSADVRVELAEGEAAVAAS